MNNFKIKVYKDFGKEIFSEWEGLWKESAAANIWNSPYWFKSYLEAFRPVKYIIVFINSSEGVNLICPFVETRKFGIKIFENPNHQILDKSSILYSGKDPQIVNYFLSEISKIDNYLVSEIKSDFVSVKNKYVEKISSSVNYYLPLGDNPFRHIRRKKFKDKMKLINKYKDKISYASYTASDLSKMEIAYKISENSYKTRAKGYKDTFSDQKIKVFFDQLIKYNPNNISLDFLIYEGNPIAFYMGYICDKTYYAFQTAYLSEYKDINPGIILNFFRLQRLQKEGLEMFDFGRGGGRHKREITPQFRVQNNIIVSRNIAVKYWFKLASCTVCRLQNCEKIYKIYCLFRKDFRFHRLNLNLVKTKIL